MQANGADAALFALHELRRRFRCLCSAAARAPRPCAGDGAAARARPRPRPRPLSRVCAGRRRGALQSQLGRHVGQCALRGRLFVRLVRCAHCGGGRRVGSCCCGAAVAVAVACVAVGAELGHERGEVQPALHQRRVGAHLADARAAVVAWRQHHDAVDEREQVQLIAAQQPRLAGHRAADGALKHRVSHLRVQRAQRVVEDDNVGVRVHGARQGHPLLLPAA